MTDSGAKKTAETKDEREHLWSQLKIIKPPSSRYGDEVYLEMYDTFAQAQDKMRGSAYSADKLRITLTFEQIIEIIAEHAPGVAPQNQWISVKERLPEFTCAVWFFVRGVGMRTGWYEGMHILPWWNLDHLRDRNISCERYDDADVAYWMPRPYPEWPAAPKEGDKQMADDCVTEIAERMCTTRYAPNNLHSLESIVERAIRMTIEGQHDEVCESSACWGSNPTYRRNHIQVLRDKVCARLRSQLEAEKKA